MQTPTLAIATYQGCIVGIGEDAGELNITGLTDLSEQILNISALFRHVAHVDADRQSIMAIPSFIDQLGQQGDWQVIDAVIAEIL